MPYLKTLKISQDTPREARNVTYLSEFSFDVRTLPTALNPADTLSRVKCDDASCVACTSVRKFLSVPFTFTENENNLPNVPTKHKDTQTDRRRTLSS